MGTMARHIAAVSRRCSIRRAFLPALAFVACFAAPGMAEPRTAVLGGVGVLMGSQVDLGPAFSLRLVRRVKYPVTLGIEVASGIAHEVPTTYAIAAASGFRVSGNPTERMQFLDAIAILDSRRGPYAILGAGVYNRVTRTPRSVPPDPQVNHRVDAGFSGGVGYAGSGRVAPMVEYRVHIHGRAGGGSRVGSGSSLDALWIGSAGLACRF